MTHFERLEFPKKYSIPGIVQLSVLILIIVGIWIQNCSQKQLTQEIRISNIEITEYSRVHIEVHYTIKNTSSFNREIWLLLKAYDTNGEELGSSLYSVKTVAGKTQPMLKIMDKLTRPLNKGEKPDKATIVLYTRKVI